MRLQTKIIITVLVFTLVPNLTSVYFDHHLRQEQTYNRLSKKMANQSKILSQVCSRPLYDMNSSKLKANLQSFLDDREISSITLIERNGPINIKLGEDESDESSVERKSEIYFGGDKIGDIIVVYSRAPVQAELTASVRQQIIAVVISTVFIIISLLFALKKIIQPILSLTSIAVEIADGNLEKDIVVTTNDEVGILARSFKAMQRSIKEKVDALQDKIWISSGHDGVNNVIRKRTSIPDLAGSVCRYLAAYLDVELMSFMIAENDQLKVVGGYGYTYDDSSEMIYRRDGVCMQVIRDKKILELRDIPDDGFVIKSSTTEIRPRHIVVVPLISGEVVEGVIEIGSLTTISPKKIELLKQLRNSIAIAVRVLCEQEKASVLLLETQRQSEELINQQEKLKASNEDLQKQTGRLESSEEVLKEQSKELQNTNEELRMRQSEVNLQKEKLEAKAEELALTSKYKSEFLANMSHEFRTPLNSLLLLSKGLSENRSGCLDDESIKDAEVIHSASRSLLALVDDIMDLSKVEAGQLVTHFEVADVEDMLNNLQSIFSPVAVHKDLYFIIDMDEAVPSRIMTDWQRLEQILKNLLGNAIKFTEIGGVTLRILPYEKLWNQNGQKQLVIPTIVFVVEDTGIGIPADKQNAIFEAFQQQDGSISRKYGGTGLGLSIARELSRLIGCEITLESEPGKGSTFSLFLPVLETDSFIEQRELPTVDFIDNDSADCALNNEPKSKAVDLFIEEEVEPEFEIDQRCLGNRILLIDEDMRHSYAFSADLIAMGFDVQMADSIDHAIEIFSNNRTFDLLITDLKAIEEDITSSISGSLSLASYYSGPIIAMMNTTNIGDSYSCSIPTITLFVNKPIDNELFLPVIEKVLLEKYHCNDNDENA